MSANHVDLECPLCPARCEEKAHAEAWYRLQDTADYDAVAERGQELGLAVSAEQAKEHFTYHRPVQPAARGYLKRERALERSRELTARQRELVLLVSRVRGLSGTQIAELMYWTGEKAQLSSARENARRDLRRLIFGDFLYRWYPPPVERASAAPRRARRDQLSLYFLGRDGVPLVEEREGYELERREWIARPAQLSDRFRTMAIHYSTEIVTTLNRQLRELQSRGGKAAVDGIPIELSFQPLNWFDAARCLMYYKGPASGEGRITPGGLAAFGVEVPQSSLSVLCPFFYEHDAGTRATGAFAEELISYVRLSRSDAVSRRFPDLPTSFMPPVLVVCREPHRVAALRRASQRLLARRGLSGDLPAIVLCDELTLEHHGLLGESWVSLWDSSAEPRRYRLLEVLVRCAKPLIGSPVQAGLRLECAARSALRD